MGAGPVPPEGMCECDHASRDHAGGTGRCGGLDSYGQPCTCPSWQPVDDGDPHDPVAAAEDNTALRIAGETGRAPARDNYDTNRH